MNTQLNDTKLELKLQDNPQLPALVTLIIGDFKIRGFTIRPSQFTDSDKKFVFYPPSSRSGNKWIKIFWTDSKELWKELEEKALNQFDEEHTEYLLKTTIDAQNNEIKVENIDY